MAFAKAVNVSQFNSSDNTWDAIVVIAASIDAIEDDTLRAAVSSAAQVDGRIASSCNLIITEAAPGKRLIYSPTGALTRYFDDVRRFHDAAQHATNLIIDAGVVSPLLMVYADSDERYSKAAEVAFLAINQTAWQPLEARESLVEDEIEPLTQIGMLNDVDCHWLNAAEAGCRVARDICGTNPERMAPPLLADYCVEALSGSSVKVEVVSSQEQLKSEYPLLFSVARASEQVARHNARVITMTYEGKGEIKHTLYLAGKGVTFDTGGADLKTDGHMAGMSRDKGGAAAVAGFMKMLADLQPEGIKVVAEIGAVRNSIGSEAFVSDEIITSRAGVRVRIGNTDAEGRLVLSDVMTHLLELAENDANAEFFSVATLTGHAARAVGPYTALVENGKARSQNSAHMLSAAGDLWADPAEVSRSRREDFDFVKPRTKADDILSSNNAASAVTARGHQFPMAFLVLASGLDKHDVAYTHVDIAGSGVESGDWQHGKPTAAPVMMLAGRYLN
ncbi:MAG: leucyl aminopeptidase family protein [Alteromonadaceae bacterium]|nr:leucyl aminopeptidase family protein [Alteromonadaceae bacterium]